LTLERIEIIERLADVDAKRWTSLAGNNPFLRHEFLNNLETSRCVSAETGWEPRHILIWRKSELVGAMPLYLKHHSYGEYIFDWAWADAYQRHGLDYFPKLSSAIPFTPVSGERLLSTEPQVRKKLAQAALELAKELRVSSLHILYPCGSQANELAQSGYLSRDSTQFHWYNKTYESFDTFLGEMSHDKRKKIKQERRKLIEQNIRFQRLEGEEINLSDWEFFNRCYQTTYRQHHSSPYLNLEFFTSLGRDMPENVVMFNAQMDNRPIAASLCLKNDERLFGRYWGSEIYVPGLHFETCYYQGIDYCIENKLQVFEGGVQGEHKIARGLLPVKTFSNHWLAHPQFSSAIADFLARESVGVARYVDELNDMVPFKNKDEKKAAQGEP
jgi:uncharacterized protein